MTEADTWTIYVQNYTIKSHRLDPYQSMVLRVDLPDGRFNWKATVGGAKESKIREDAAALLRKIGTNLQFADSEFRTGITVPESNYRSATNTTTTPAGVLEVIRVRPTDKGTRDGR